MTTRKRKPKPSAAEPPPALPPEPVPALGAARVRLSELQGRGGLQCRLCGCCDFRTVRTVRAGGAVRRERICRHCGHRVFTREVVTLA